jgi:hypothetical protein
MKIYRRWKKSNIFVWLELGAEADDENHLLAAARVRAERIAHDGAKTRRFLSP